MSVNTDRIRYLFRQYLQKTCSEQEMQELFACIAQPGNRALVEELMDAEYEVLQPVAGAPETDWEHMFEQAVLPKREKQVNISQVKRLLWMRAAAAAIVVIAVGVVGYWLINRSTKNGVAKNDQPVQRSAADILPGSNKAALTLADGSVITLDSAANGQLAQQGGSQIIKTKNGELVYDKTAKNAAGPHTTDHSPLAYNTLVIPRGGQYQLTLPDGSRVWLNAASSLRYPVAFIGNDRRVELTGEAYFEVAKDAHKPFHVITPTQDVEVLGTHFNVNAYSNEPSTRTTLLEGAVKVTPVIGNQKSAIGNRQSAILKPGEQAVFIADSRFTIHDADLEDVMAWKNGFTLFNKADLKSIMRQVERWYNVDVVYEGDLPQRTFTGGIERSARLSELLRLLEVSKVKFRVEGNRLIVHN
ncbi:FecR family protein [Niastella sp. OAS944]|uniref:FecR family protein n=1 Tax=Niastella sp. OAS944 TaxID=2664089 RepID=UPI003469B2A9|nr:ferric-dicitrate binding protein FerR (iron transport regulator) [Chitinophagaceae bacterium OAS944]